MMHGELYSVEKLGHVLENGDTNSVLMLDCRLPNDYNASHIKGALHVFIPSIMLRRLKKGNLSVDSVIKCSKGKERFTNKCQNDLVILYDENTRDVSNPSNVVNQLLKKLRDDGCMAFILSGGFEDFKQEYPHLCAGLQAESEDHTILGLSNLNITDITSLSSKNLMNCDQKECPTPSNNNVFPVQVLPYLFLGNAQNSSDIDCLYEHSISYIINVTPDVENKFQERGTIKYLQIPISDHWSQNISHYFPKAISFIDEAKENNSGVLVHCLAGISRSVTVTVAYLMHSLKLSLNDAYDFVKTKKPNISPNFNFMGQLTDFEKSLKIRDCDCMCPKDNLLTIASSSSVSPVSVSEFSSTPASTSSSANSSPPSSSEHVMSSPEHQTASSSTDIIANTTTSTNILTTNVGHDTLIQPSTQCTCSCHELKSFFFTPSSISSNSSCSSSNGPDQFSYNNIPSPS